MRPGESENPIICGRRNCVRCTRWKHAVDFKWRWNKKRVPNVRPNARTKTIALRSRYPSPVVDAVCKSCRRQESRERYHNLSAEEKRAVQQRANNNAIKLRAKWEREIEYARMSVIGRNRAPNRDDPELDIVPFRMWILGQIRLHGSTAAVGRIIGVNEARIRRIADGYYWPSDYQQGYCDEPVPLRTVKMTTVDIFGVKAGDPGLLSRLYPYVEPD